MRRRILNGVFLTILLCAAVWRTPARASGLPEPGLFMYGVIRNAASGNARLVSGTLTWTMSQTNGSPIAISAALCNIGSQYSYLLRVPFESVIGSGSPSPNVLQLNTNPATYFRTNVTLTIGTNIFPATISAPSSGTFTFGPADRGKTEQVDLTISDPATDTYGIGIPDTWQLAHFGYVGIDPNADPDHDGMSNLQEYIAGTDPNDPNSVFEFTRIQQVALGVTELQWPGETNRMYSVLSAAGLAGATNSTVFVPIRTNIAATPPLNTVLMTNPPETGPYFYRLSVSAPP